MLGTARPTVLVATDFTPSSRGAFDEGVRLAKELEGRLLLVHAVRPLGAPGLELTRPDTTKEENETAEPVPAVGLAGTEWVDLARAQGVEADVVVKPGLPAVVIVDEAQRVDAHTIVLGSQGKEGISKALLGSVADDVRKTSGRPVLVVADDHAVGAGVERPARPLTRRERLEAMQRKEERQT
jgi:nucleotide-binding universal stress UspA family protein